MAGSSYATAVNEINAKSGVIIACPTAGSCGILPGVLTAWMEDNPNSEKKILESLMVAGFFGMILFTDVSTAEPIMVAKPKWEQLQQWLLRQ